MRACVLPSPGPVERAPLQLVDLSTPEPAADEVLIRVHACGVCRTDLHVVEGELAPRLSPVIPGHQVIGVVERCGREASLYPPGTRVGVAWLHRTCGSCEFCLSGREISANAPTSRAFSGSPILRALKKGGTLILGGIHMSPIPALPYELLYHERSIRSVANNTREDGRDFLKLAAEIPLHPEVQVFRLKDANQALVALKSDAIRGAAVLQI